jgi:Flp pilus assembly pilin Flp
MARKKGFRSLGADERGASAVEYAILIGSVALTIVSGAYLLGERTATWYTRAAQMFDAPAPPAAPTPEAPPAAAPAKPGSGAANPAGNPGGGPEGGAAHGGKAASE